jgi:ABC-type multidrug transport system fused ATPase/permease subunit
MAEKKTLSGRVPADTEERFEEFRMRRGLNKTDAMRRLIEEGLDSYEQDQAPAERSATADESEDVEIGPLTQSEKWFRKKFESTLAGMFLSAPATLALILAFGLTQSLLNVNAAEWLPTQLLAVVIFIGMSAFLMFAVGAIVTYVVLKLGIARRLDQRAEAGEKEAATG